jgi:uncharacterized protein
MSTENVELARETYDAWMREGFDAIETMVAEDMEFVPAVAAAVEGGSVRGRDEVRRFFENLDEIWETFRIEPEEFRAFGDRVLMVGHLRAKGRGSGLELDQPMFSVVWFRDGKIARMQSFLDGEAALETVEREVVE